MKKIFVIAAAALLIGSTANAQDVKKQQGGERNLEVLFTPFGDSPIGINGIKYRSFTSATNAWRANVSLGFNTTSDKREEGADNTELVNSTNNFNIGIAPGYEWHFPGTDRLSPYVGAEVSLTFRSNGGTDEVLVATDVVELENSMSTFGAGAGVFAGFDFYFADNVYLGAELNYGFGFLSMGAMTQDAFNATGEVIEVETPGGSSFGIGEGVVGSIRAGFLF
ncbi:MAG: outer membrane protein W [Cryomorphaceae bacterium]|jgi:outer membrane protein W